MTLIENCHLREPLFLLFPDPPWFHWCIYSYFLGASIGWATRPIAQGFNLNDILPWLRLSSFGPLQCHLRNTIWTLWVVAETWRRMPLAGTIIINDNTIPWHVFSGRWSSSSGGSGSLEDHVAGMESRNEPIPLQFNINGLMTMVRGIKRWLGWWKWKQIVREGIISASE